jgi:hypothetical protein
VALEQFSVLPNGRERRGEGRSLNIPPFAKTAKGWAPSIFVARTKSSAQIVDGWATRPLSRPDARICCLKRRACYEECRS